MAKYGALKDEQGETVARFIQVPTFSIFKMETQEWAKDEHFWLAGDLVYKSDYKDADGNPLLVKVDDGFYTDFASLPRWPSFIRGIFVKNGKHRPAAVVHDHLCRLGKAFPRPLADKIFYEAMKSVHVKRWHRRLMYLAVRANTQAMIWTGRAVRKWEDVEQEEVK